MSAVLVVGATGQQGGAVARHLLAANRTVRALVRDTSGPAARELEKSGATLVRGDLEDRASLVAAFRGVEQVFSVQNGYPPTGPDGEFRQGTNVAVAAREAGVVHLVQSSVGGADRRSGVPHFESKWRVEEQLHSLGVPATVVRPVFFMENFTAFLGPRMVDGDLVVSMAISEETRLQMIAVDDIGRIVARIFSDPDGYVGRSLEIAGDECTGAQLATVFGAVTGLPTKFQEQPLEQVRAFSEDAALMFRWFQAHGFRADVGAVREEFPGMLRLQDWLRRIDWKPSTGWAH